MAGVQGWGNLVNTMVLVILMAAWASTAPPTTRVSGTLGCLLAGAGARHYITSQTFNVQGANIVVARHRGPVLDSCPCPPSVCQLRRPRSPAAAAAPARHGARVAAASCQRPTPCRHVRAVQRAWSGCGGCRTGWA